jgi:hypothetical protein
MPSSGMLLTLQSGQSFPELKDCQQSRQIESNHSANSPAPVKVETGVSFRGSSCVAFLALEARDERHFLIHGQETTDFDHQPDLDGHLRLML